MATTVPAKIVLKSGTKMSLNDRFSKIQKMPTVQNIRANMASQHEASIKNRRLAQQMENRPSVMAALQLQKKSLRQRLGTSNIKSRLNLPQDQQDTQIQRGRGRGRGRGWGRGRGQLVTTGNRGTLQRGRGRGGRGRGYRGNFNNRGRDQEAGHFQSWRGKDNFRGNPSSRNPLRGRGGFQGRGRGQRGGFVPRGGRGRGFRGGRGFGRGRGSAGSVSREQLDNQLEAYMSKTRSFLDSELDSYMTEQG